MPSTEEHLTKAAGNEDFALSVELNSRARIDWALVAIFYAAMHYVEAYLAASGQHLKSHATRDSVIGRDAQLKQIYLEYQDLKFYGYNARYEVSTFTATDFNDEAITSFTRIKDFIKPLL